MDDCNKYVRSTPSACMPCHGSPAARESLSWRRRRRRRLSSVNSTNALHCIYGRPGGTVKASHEVWSIQNGQGRTPRHAQPTCGRARVARCGYLAAAAVLVGLAVLTRLFGSVLLGVSLTAHAGVHAGQVHARTHCTYYVTTQPCPCMCMWCVHVRHVLDQFSSHVGQNTWR